MADEVVYDDESRDAILVGGQVLHNVHAPDECSGVWCCIHRPSDHHMRSWPQNWRQDRRLMERICPHGIGYPDPDAPTLDGGIHGCDGCCHDPRKDLPVSRSTTPGCLAILGAVALLGFMAIGVVLAWGWIIMIGLGFAHSYDESIPALGWFASSGIAFPFAALSLTILGSSR